MRFLVIGDMGSIFIPNFLEIIASYYSNSIFDVISHREERVVLGRNTNCYIIPSRRNSLLNRIPKVRGIYAVNQKRRFIAKSDSYDICNVHFVDNHSPLLSRVLSRRCKNIVSSVWGSDFYRSSGSIRRVQERLYKISNVITFTNEKSMMEFDEYYDKRYSRKLRICRFGLAPLEVLRSLELNKKECRKSLGLPEKPLVVTIGYNNSPAQQHIKILNSIEKHKREIPKNVFLVLPMTYGATEEYRNTVRKHLEQHSFGYRIFDKFMPDREMAMLRKASDLMIQVQTTDQFSGSMQEHLYTENVVITGDWLPYGTLDEKGVFMLKVSSVDEVGEKLVYAINNLDSLKDKCKDNPEIIWELSSWEKNIQSWIDIYEELLQRGRQ
jgi:glycosyltransferase involved in cell wall biosynthesis